MKLLCINIHPDFTWLTSKGLKLDVTFEISPKQIFPLFQKPSSQGTLYIPDVSILANTKVGYDVIIVGWNIKDYDSRVYNTGGFAYPDKQPNGARICSVRADDLPINMYPVHEMMHTLCNFINIDFGDHVPKDFMDTTPVNGVWFPYYLNDPNINNPNSNFNQTWRNIIPFLGRLNTMGSHWKYFKLTEWTNSEHTHTVAELNTRLVDVLDIMRGECGFPFRITSGKRTKFENDNLIDAVGNSAHLTGLAVDIQCITDEQRYKMKQSAYKNGLKRIGTAKTYLHFDIDETKPQYLEWLYN